MQLKQSAGRVHFLFWKCLILRKLANTESFGLGALWLIRATAGQRQHCDFGNCIEMKTRKTADVG